MMGRLFPQLNWLQHLPVLPEGRNLPSSCSLPEMHEAEREQDHVPSPGLSAAQDLLASGELESVCPALQFFSMNDTLFAVVTGCSPKCPGFVSKCSYRVWSSAASEEIMFLMRTSYC